MHNIILVLNTLVTYTFYLFIRGISYLPLWMLYRLSDCLFFIIYYLFRYRKNVTRNNLKNAFPEKTQKEIIQIEKKYYRHLSDIIIESIKSFSISPEELKKRMKLINPELLDNLFNRGIPLIAVTGHFHNWEWAAMSLPFHSRYHPQGIYKAIKNKIFNNLMFNSRSRFGIELIETSKLSEKIKESQDDKTIIGFIADQRPSNPGKALWINFLNQETAVAFGTEKYARQHEKGVVFGDIKSIKRGFYTIEYVLITDNPKELPEGYITLKHSRLLENKIRLQPEYWLWSHKRWKHRRPQNITIYS